MEGMAPSPPRWLPTGLAHRLRELELLGEGGFGRVVRARDLRLGRDVAVKILRASLPDLASRARFEREARVTASLRHPHVVSVFDFGVDEDGTAWIVYEYLAGTSLAALAATGPLPAVRVTPWLTQLADALGAAHAMGVVHRDVKPENVLVREDDAAVLVDFGIARKDQGTTVETGVGLVLGTPAYMAPEALLRGEIAPAADQFALGVLGYRLLSGRLPWGAGVTERLDALRSGTPPIPFEPADRDAWGLTAPLLRAMASQPNERFPDLAAFAAAIVDGSGSRATVRLKRPTSGERSGEGAGPLAGSSPTAISAAPAALPGRRSTARRIWAGSGLVAFGLAIGIGLGLGLGRDPDPGSPAGSSGPSQDPPSRPDPLPVLLAGLRSETQALARRLGDPEGPGGLQVTDLSDALQVETLTGMLPSLPGTLREVTAHLAGAGLDRDLQDDLAGIDESLESLGLEAPFAFGAGPPPGTRDRSMPSRLRSLVEAVRWHEDAVPESASGWAGEVFEAMETCLDLRQELEEVLLSDQAIEGLPPLLVRLRPLVRFSDQPLSKVTGGMLRSPADRAAIFTWLRPATRAFRRAVMAASVAALDPNQGWAALLVHLKPHLVGPLLMSQALFGPERGWLAPGPDTPARDLIAGSILYRTADILEGWAEDHLVRRREGISRLLRVARAAGDDPATRRLRGAAILELVSDRSRQVAPEVLRELLIPLARPEISLHPLDRARILLATFSVGTGLEALGPDAARLLQTLRSLDGKILPAWFHRELAEVETGIVIGRISLPASGDG